jgi:hypothetical protein
MRRRFILAATLAIAALLMLGGATAQAAPGSLRVLLVETQGAPDFTSFVAALKAKPGIAAVDDFDAAAGTPEASSLAGYDLIVSTGDASYNDAELYGNRLADYIDAGGAVIQFAYDNWNPPDAHPRGRFESGGYAPFIPGTNDNLPTTLAPPLVPGSPLLAGVPSFTTDLNTTDALAPGATLLASYTDGRNAIATKGRVVSVTSTPGYGGDDLNPIDAAAQLALNGGNVLGRHTVKVKKKGGAGTVTSAPAGIKCGKTCTATFAGAASITLKAKAKAKKSSFARWKGVPGCKKKSKCTFTPTASTTVKAKFTKR